MKPEERTSVKEEETMENLQELIKRLNEIESKNWISEIKRSLMELDQRKRKESDSEDTRWNLVGMDYLPVERQPLYLTVEEKEGGERKVIEGFLEDEKWYDEGGGSLKSKGFKVIAWLPKDVPEPCRKTSIQ